MSIRELAVALVQQYCCHFNYCRCCLLPYNIDGCKQTQHLLVLQLRGIDRLAAYVLVPTARLRSRLLITQRFAARDDGGVINNNSLYEPLRAVYYFHSLLQFNTTNTDGSSTYDGSKTSTTRNCHSPLKVLLYISQSCFSVVSTS